MPCCIYLWEMEWKWNFRFANKKSFIFVFGIVGLIFASSHAYYNGTITTMEKRFKIPSANMGFIATGNDITGFLLSMFIAYYGGRGKCFPFHLNIQVEICRELHSFVKVIDHVGWHSASLQSLFIVSLMSCHIFSTDRARML